MVHAGAIAYALLAALFAGFLGLELLVLNRGSTEPTLRRAAYQSLLALTVALLVGVVILAAYGGPAATQYYGGLVVEDSLSFDNVFVWALLLDAFEIAVQYQRLVLRWGVVMSVVMRIGLILGGIQMFSRFALLMAVFGIVLVISGAVMFFSESDDSYVLEQKWSYRFLCKILPIAEGTYGSRYFVREDGSIRVTRVALSIIMFGLADLLFALDSVPAVLGVTQDPFLVIASNAMALLGLMSLYFLIVALKERLSRLDEGVAVVLAFVGAKMVVGTEYPAWVRIGSWHPEQYELPIWLGICVILTILGLSAAASLAWPKRMAA